MSKKHINGLTDDEVLRSREKHGTNALSEKEEATLLEIFIDSLKDIWLLILIAGLALKVLINILQPHEANWYEVISLVVAIALASGFATQSEYSNQKEFAKLQMKAGKIMTNVVRNGQMTEVMIDDIVKGDVIKLRAGDQIPADGFILEGKIKVDQASLNGESDPAKKVALGDAPKPEPQDTFNEYLLLRGSNVLEGEAYMVADVIGDATMIGSINTSLQEDTKVSPSNAKLAKLAKQIGILGTGTAILYVIITIAQLFISDNRLDLAAWLSALLAIGMYAVTIIIMAVPEGLPMMTSMVGGMNSKRLLKEDILVRNTESIETAGYMNIQFSDKTGTITTGKMEVVDLLLGNGDIFTRDKDSDEKPLAQLDASYLEILSQAVGLNNDAYIYNEQGTGSNPTDNTLMTFLYQQGLTDFDRDSIVDKELFDSAKKFASVTTEDGVTYLKGAPEFIPVEITHYLDAAGQVQPFTADIQALFTAGSDAQANRAMRVLSVLKIVDGQNILVAGICMRDNVRPGLPEVIKQANEAGVQVVMVTGDRKETAVAIAKDAGILTKDDQIVLTHAELEDLSDEKVKEILPNLRVVARALPMDKKRLVQLAQDLDMVVGMTGDGVNDAAALRAADVGFALGDGTQTAQSASDMVLVNNSFNTILTAILYGRTMTKTVQKFLIFQLTVNVSTLAMSVLGPLFGFREPFTIVQVLEINLIMDTLAALAFALEPALPRYLKERPIARTANILTGYMMSAIGSAALYITIIAILTLTNTFGMDRLLDLNGPAETSTFMFSTFVYTILVNSFNTRSETFNLLENIGKNKRFLWIIGGIFIGQTLLVQFGGDFMATTPMDLKHYLYAFIISLAVIPFDFIRKLMIKVIK